MIKKALLNKILIRKILIRKIKCKEEIFCQRRNDARKQNKKRKKNLIQKYILHCLILLAIRDLSIFYLNCTKWLHEIENFFLWLWKYLDSFAWLCQVTLWNKKIEFLFLSRNIKFFLFDFVYFFIWLHQVTP